MTINSFASFSSDTPKSPEPAITCPECHTADYLILESLGQIVPPIKNHVSLEYSCGNCESFFAHNASVQDVAQFLQTQPGTSEITRIGAAFIHCGEPMEEGGILLSALKMKDGDLVDAPALTVESKGLRCQCGFQMTIPSPTRR